MTLCTDLDEKDNGGLSSDALPESNWLSSVEILTHSPHLRPLWVVPQFSFKTFHSSPLDDIIYGPCYRIIREILEGICIRTDSSDTSSRTRFACESGTESRRSTRLVETACVRRGRGSGGEDHCLSGDRERSGNMFWRDGRSETFGSDWYWDR